MIEKNKIILGVKITSHDTGAAIVSGNRVVAIAEERLCRIKHSTNIFPELSIEYCLNTLNISPADIDLIVIDKVGFNRDDGLQKLWSEKTGGKFAGVETITINHHDAHAAAAFFCSPFDDAAVLIVDGAGEKINTHLGVAGTETETLYRGTGNTLTQIDKTIHLREKTRFPYTIGIAKLYTFFCEGLINLGHFNEGKMMGLAPYGTRDLLKQFPLSRWIVEKDGYVLCNPNVTFPGDGGFWKKKKAFRSLDRLFRSILKKVSFFALSKAVPNTFTGEPHIFSRVNLPLPARPANGQLPDKKYNDAAFLIQQVFEEVMVIFGRKIKAITHAENLCIAGGAGLNIDANKRFLDDVGFKRLFVQPAASDTGIALGCALYGAHQILKLPRMWQMKSASLGRTYTEKEIISAIEARKNEINVNKSSQIAVETAKIVAGGKIVGWFHGGSEYGPRALGNRSILADARNPNMLKILNERVKHRELWRPFAASVLEDKMKEWFDINHESPFMLLASQVHKDKQPKVPSIVHVDGTCRIQSVTSESNARYCDLLKAFEKGTGVPLFLNTSFNVAGEPIVETPDDALRCFLGTDIDALVLEDYIITKK